MECLGGSTSSATFNFNFTFTLNFMVAGSYSARRGRFAGVGSF